MEARDELLTIAQIAVSLAGFSGVVAGFMQRGGLSLADRVRFVLLFTCAFSALLLAFIPIVLAHGGLENAPLWRASSFAMIVVWLASVVPAGPAFRTVRSELNEKSLLWPALGLVPALGNLFVQIANVGGWFWEPGLIAYLFGLLVWLFVAGVMFILIVLVRPPD